MMKKTRPYPTWKGKEKKKKKPPSVKGKRKKKKMKKPNSLNLVKKKKGSKVVVDFDRETQYVVLITEMLFKIKLWKLKTPKMCF